MIHTENSILMKATLERIFSVAADLSSWPRILPHYRWIKYHEQSALRNIVVMAAWRNIATIAGLKIPIRWTSEQWIDRDKTEIRFRHLKSFSKGMMVVWSFTPTAEGCDVRITHDFSSSIPVIGVLLIEPIVGRFFAQYVADRTLACMKDFVESHRGT